MLRLRRSAVVVADLGHSQFDDGADIGVKQVLIADSAVMVENVVVILGVPLLEGGVSIRSDEVVAHLQSLYSAGILLASLLIL